MINQNNFDWQKTNKEIIIFIPNYGRKQLILPGLKRFQTNLPRERWSWLIVNDCIHEDFSDIANEFNILWFTFEREPKERNGSQIRNYVIKNVQSKILASKDPEIILTGSDYIERIINLQDKQIHRPWGTTELMEMDSPKIINNDNLDIGTLKPRRHYPSGNPKTHEGFHFSYACHTKLLKDIGGYDERFKNTYGWEDVDLLDRLHMLNCEFIMDKEIHAYHIWHARRTKFLKGVGDNAEIYRQKQKNPKIIANENNIEWGTAI